MAKPANIIIADESALFFYEHMDMLEQCGIRAARNNPLECSASSAEEYGSFNVDHPLYGGAPISVLVKEASERRRLQAITCRCCPEELPKGSFYKMRDGLYIATPELLFARMGNFVSVIRLAEIGMNLCARYYIKLDTGRIDDRHVLLTTPAKLVRYLDKAQAVRGAGKARRALKWVVANSGSPYESKMMALFAIPLWAGGLGLPLTHMNYDVSAGRLANLTEQGDFCIDSVNPRLMVGLEYNGEEWHQDAGKDNRRLNALSALGWRVFVIDKSVLFDPERSVQAALQIAKYINMRIQWPKNWREKHRRLRKELGLLV